MSHRVAQGVTIFAVEADGSIRVAQGTTKFAVTATDDIRVAQGMIKFAVRIGGPRTEFFRNIPPIRTSQSRAPYIKSVEI